MNSENKLHWGVLKKALVTCSLTWLVPGLGHLLLGKKLRAIVFFIVVHLSFILGFAADGRFFLVDKRAPVMSYLQTFANISAGPLDVAARTYIYGYPAYFLPKDEGPEYADLLMKMRERMKSLVSAYGTAYLLTAGLMNMLLILDVFDISIGRKE